MLSAFLRRAALCCSSPTRALLIFSVVLFAGVDVAGAQSLSFDNQSVRVRRATDRDADQNPLALNRQDCLEDVPGATDFDIATRQGTRTWLEMSAIVSGTVPRNAVLEVWASRGVDCSDNQERLNTGNCWRVDRRNARNARILTAVVRPRVVVAREDITDLDPNNPDEYPTEEVCNTTVDDAHTFYLFLIDGDRILSQLTWSDTRVDLVAPDPPAVFSASPGDENIFLDWEVESAAEDPDTEGFAFFCVEAGTLRADSDGGAGGGGGVTCEQNLLVAGEYPPLAARECGSSRGQGTRRGQIRNVENGTTYAVAISTTDFLNNPGALSEVVCVQPREVETFFERYREAGGRGGGGFCSVSRPAEGKMLLLLVGTLLFVWRLRRVGRATAHRARSVGRTALLVTLLGVSSFLPSKAAHAHQEDAPISSSPRTIDPARDPERLQSKRYGAFEFRAGPYFFGIDREFEQGSPFADAFGDRPAWAFGFEGDWQALRIPHFGSLGPGLAWHYVQRSTTAEFVDSATGDDSAASVESQHPDRLWMMPIFAVAVLRVDVLKRDFSVPFVPYAKLGFALNLWEARDARRVSDVDGVKGRGLETGWTLHLGGMLHLNPLAPQAAADMDSSSGVNDAYLFAEWWYSEVDSFGRGLESGSNTLSAGITLEF